MSHINIWVTKTGERKMIEKLRETLSEIYWFLTEVALDILSQAKVLIFRASGGKFCIECKRCIECGCMMDLWTYENQSRQCCECVAEPMM